MAYRYVTIRRRMLNWLVLIGLQSDGFNISGFRIYVHLVSRFDFISVKPCRFSFTIIPKADAILNAEAVHLKNFNTRWTLNLL